ncbi:NAD-dependent epimerase/dehydratase family protein [Variovorax sp. 770b2]|uniref:NAD-dependent epimerase/dehydratase family protein n=1 Tax=Variovorax sp. 770b2 TaxID=1566271 RepID=UPI0008E21FBD|nr:NAD-dependent epimerase/dehydratase family protein [Variovorax sp. 770b2]SFP59155.1 NAD(P)H-binding [Variovorax sp. 770b2]
MNILIFGATGMVGQGVLRECLLAPDVERVVAVGRNATGQQHAKLQELVVKDMYDYTAVEPQLQGFDACFFCLGVSSVGMKEDDYRRVTYDLTMAAATVLARLNPGMTFTYVTGSGTDSSERGSSMWARVKGATENALLRLPFKAAYMFRPGIIQPLHGARSKTPLYHSVYMVISPLLSLAYRLWPDKVTTSEQIGLAMLAVARGGAPKVLLDPADINALR